MTKRVFGLLLALTLVFSLFGCGKEEEDTMDVIAKTTMRVYNMFFEETTETAEVSLYGELPSRTEETGDFSGRIRVKAADGEIHSYKGLSFCWAEELLLVYKGNPTKQDGKGCIAWIDPENPQDMIFLDRDWCEPNPETEIMVYADQSLSALETRALQTKINQLSVVITAEFVTKEEVLQEFVSKHEGDTAFSGVSAEDLRDRYVVRVKTEDADEAVEALNEIAGVAKVARSMNAESIRILGPEATANEMTRRVRDLPDLP